MATVLQTDIAIAAPIERVWNVLTDFEAYPDWNPFILTVEGEALEGDRLRVTMRPPGGMPIVIRPTILIVEEPFELRWRGRLLVPGLFDGEHFFELATVRGGCKLVHGEIFTGILPGALGGLMAQTELGFKLMNAALKSRVEGAR